jgi:hypothetical protein
MKSFKTATRITQYIYNLIIVIQFIFPQLKLHELSAFFDTFNSSAEFE